MTLSIGFVGCGRMGMALLKRAHERGHQVAGTDPNTATENELAAIGARYAPSITSLIQLKPTAIIFCLADAQVSQRCLKELLEARSVMRQPKVLIQASTLSPLDIEKEARAVSGAGLTYIDAPVSGGPQGGYLTSIAAAHDAEFDEALPTLDSYSDRVFRVGDQPGQGQIAKLVNNALSLGTLALASEVIAKGVAAGLNLAMLVDVINASSGRSAVTEQKFVRSIVPGTYDYGASMAVALKDMSAFQEYFGLHDGVIEHLSRAWAEGKTTFGAEADFTSIYKLYAREAVSAGSKRINCDQTQGRNL